MFSLRTSFRYAFSRTRGQRTTSIMILVGIAVGLVALLVISSVMNGLQTAQMDQLRNLESFDLIVKSDKLDGEELSGIPGVDMAFGFLETNVLVVDKTSGISSSARMRAYDGNVLSSSRMSESLYLLNGDSMPTYGIYMSYTMMRKLNLKDSDDMKITFLKPGKTATIVPYTSDYRVEGYYSSRMSEFSSSTLFMDFDSLAGIIGTEDSRIGVYVDGNQSKVIRLIQEKDPDAVIITWQEYNKALYSALMLEKTLMYVFLAFMFLIICVNLKNSTRRLLVNKQKEGAMLRALGCSRAKVNFIFLTQGMIVCLLGEILGIVVGKIVIANLQGILGLVDRIVTLFTGRATVLTQVPFNAAVGNGEIAIVCLFVFALSLLFTAIGCRRIYRNEIMEVILHASY
ncbi:MAG: ABC transporter permease [Spirochaetales bacterium]|nr:ABC transporter permease [Spirochaetales bacterium]